MIIFPKSRPFKFFAQKVLPLTYDNSLSYYEVLCKLADIVNEHSEAIKELGDIVNDFDIEVQSAVSDKLDEWYQDGTMVELVAEAGLVVTPEMYGAVGDGVTDDSTAFNSAFNSGKVVMLVADRYKARNITAKLPSMLIGNNKVVDIGESSLVYDKSVVLRNVVIECSGTSGTCITNSGYIPSVRLNGVSLVNTQATSSLRGRVGIRVSAKRTDIDGIYTYGFTRSIVYNNSDDVTNQEYINIKNVVAVNGETCIDIEGAYGDRLSGYVSNVAIDNIMLLNNSAMHSTMGDKIGKDAVLCGGVVNFNISNVVSVYARERALYVNNARNGNISNIYAFHSEGVKIAGNTLDGYDTFYTEYVNVDNINVEDGYQAFALKIYDVKHCNFSNIAIDASGYANPDSYRAIEISRTAKNIKIDGVKATNIGRGILLFDKDNVTVTDIDGVTISNVFGEDFCKSTSYSAVQFVADDCKNISLIDFTLNPNKNAYDPSTNFANFTQLHDCENVYISGIQAYGFATTNPPIVLGEDCVHVVINAMLFDAGAGEAETMAIEKQSNYKVYTVQNTELYKYKVVAKIEPDCVVREIDVHLPCSRNIYGTSNDRTIIVEGPNVGTINIVSGEATVTGEGLSLAENGAIQSTVSGQYLVKVIEQ